MPVAKSLNNYISEQPNKETDEPFGRRFEKMGEEIKWAVLGTGIIANEMFADEDVDIIYITTPHNTHYGFMKKALENGKHVLVEKSITLNFSELHEMITWQMKETLYLRKQ